jgi:hypothetical protein
MPSTAPPGDIGSLSLEAIAAIVEDQALPPVTAWNPEHVGEIDIRITRDGSWFHEGVPINRPTMVRLFSTILRRESEDRIALVTPVEKLTIRVDDTPFVAVEMQREGSGKNQQLAFRLNTGDLVIAGPDHGIEMRDQGFGLLPYLHVRQGLDAVFSRGLYYEFIELALANDPPGLWSSGAFIPLESGL